MTAPDFDIPNTAVAAYQRIWAERVYLAKLMLVPLLIKAVCETGVLYAGVEHDLIRHTLIMLPSYFAEGWLVAQFLRTVLTGERWPYPVDLSSVANEVAIVRRVRGLLACIISFVLTMMGIALLGSVLQSLTPEGSATSAATSTDPIAHILPLIAIIASIVLFRFLWLPIPLVVNTRIQDYVQITQGFLTPMRLFALWLMVSIPAVVVFLSVFSAILSVPSDVIKIFAVIFKSLIGMIITLLPLCAIALALKPSLKIS